MSLCETEKAYFPLKPPEMCPLFLDPKKSPEATRGNLKRRMFFLFLPCPGRCFTFYKKVLVLFLKIRRRSDVLIDFTPKQKEILLKAFLKLETLTCVVQ